MVDKQQQQKRTYKKSSIFFRAQATKMKNAFDVVEYSVSYNRYKNDLISLDWFQLYQLVVIWL